MATDARLRRDVLWNLVPVALLAITGLGAQFAIGFRWGPGELGVFNLVTTALFVFAVSGAAGVQFSALRAIAASPGEETGAIAASAVAATALTAAVSTAIFVALRHRIADLVGTPGVAAGIGWVAPALPCFALNKVLLAIANGRRRMRAFAIYTSLRYALIAAGVAIAWTLDLPPSAIWSIVEGTLLVALAVDLVITLPGLALAQRWIAEHLTFGSRTLAGSVATEINGKLDIWMVAAFADGPRTIGIYSLASALYEGALQLAVVVQNNLNPIIAKDLAAGDRAAVHALARRTRRWFVPTMLVACGAGALVYPTLVGWLTGRAEFADGAVPFAILVGGVVLASPMLPFAQLLLMANRPLLHTAYTFATIALAATALRILVPAHGMIGAAAATAGALVASAILLRLVAPRVNAW